MSVPSETYKCTFCLQNVQITDQPTHSDIHQVTEEAIRLEERQKIAQELLELMETSGKVLQPGLWMAAKTLDPSLNTF